MQFGCVSYVTLIFFGLICSHNAIQLHDCTKCENRNNCWRACIEEYHSRISPRNGRPDDLHAQEWLWALSLRPLYHETSTTKSRHRSPVWTITRETPWTIPKNDMDPISRVKRSTNGTIKQQPPEKYVTNASQSMLETKKPVTESRLRTESPSTYLNISDNLILGDEETAINTTYQPITGTTEINVAAPSMYKVLGYKLTLEEIIWLSVLSCIGIIMIIIMIPLLIMVFKGHSVVIPTSDPSWDTPDLEGIHHRRRSKPNVYTRIMQKQSPRIAANNFNV